MKNSVLAIIHEGGRWVAGRGGADRRRRCASRDVVGGDVRPPSALLPRTAVAVGVRSAKNRGPLLAVPVMARAIADRAAIGPPLPRKTFGHDGHEVAGALVLADKHGAGIEVAA